MKLPNANLAVVPDEKVTKYLLDEYHPQNKGKAKFYEMIGYNKINPQSLAKTLHNLAENGTVTEVEPTARGTKYVVEGSINAPNGRFYQIISVWIIQNTEKEPRLVTAYPKK
jgi:hypothetical protein